MNTFFRFSLVLAVATGAAGAVRADFISDTLGAAGPNNFSILALSGATDIALNGPSPGTTGNVGIAGATGVLSLNGSAGPSITGNVLLAPGATINGNVAAQVGGTVFTNQNLAPANTAALNAATTFNALAPTQTVPGNAVTSATTIKAANPGGLNVVNLSGGVDLNHASLTLNGPAGTMFVINTPSLRLNTSTVNLTGGLTANDVVFNLSGTGNNLNMTGGGNASVLNGVVLDANGGAAISPGEINGELIAGGSSIHIVSGGFVSALPPAPSVPEPASAVLFTLGALGMTGLVRRSRRKVAGSAATDSATPAIGTV